MKKEIHTPSSLTQIIANTNGTFANLKANQIDIIYTLYYMLYNSPPEFKSRNSTTVIFDIRFKDVKRLLNHPHMRYKELVNYLEGISNFSFNTNMLGKNTNIRTGMITRFVEKIIYYDGNNGIEKGNIRLHMDKDIVDLIIGKEKPFAKIYLESIYKLPTKNSKLLYAVMKDYIGQGGRNIPIPELSLMINAMGKRNDYWGGFNNDTLQPSIEHINELSEINVSSKLHRNKVTDEPESVQLNCWYDKKGIEEITIDSDKEIWEIIFQEDLKKRNPKAKPINNMDKFRASYKIPPERIEAYKQDIEAKEILDSNDLIYIIKTYKDTLEMMLDSEDIGYKDYKLIVMFTDIELTKTAVETVEILQQLEGE